MAIWAGIISAVVGAGLSAGLAAATAPEFADPAKSSRKTVLASLKALPGQRQVDMAARLGEAVDYNTGKTKPIYEEMTIQQALERGFLSQSEVDRMLAGKSAPSGTKPLSGAPGGGRTGAKSLDDMIRVKTGVGAETKHADFTGYGDADIHGAIARDMAQIQLDLQKEYGADFLEEALKQQELADPEGTAARRMLADKIAEMEEARKTRTRPIADSLDAQIEQELNLGRGLDSDATAAIERTLARRGEAGGLGVSDIERELESGLAGDARLQSRLQKGMGFFGSGVSPTDAAYREQQQSMSNMASFLAGRTPQSQFSNLSGGQQGASPMPQGPGLVQANPNMNQLGQQAGLQGYSAAVKGAANTVNPWFAGLSTLTRGAQVAGQAGWQPFGAN